MLRFRRVGTSFVAGVYFLTNVAATHAVEKSLWEERRAGLDRAPRYARLLSGAQSPRPWGQPIFDGGSSTSQPPSIFKNLAVPFDVASAVLPYGAIGEVRQGRPGAPLVFLVQDVHGNEGAQKNIGGLLGDLSSHGVTLTGVEGAWVPIDLSAYHQHPSPKAVSLVADAFLDSGRLSGSEWAGLTAPHPPTLVGVESPDLYHANVAAARDCVARRPAVAAFLGGVNKTLQVQKERYFSPALKAFDLHLTDYHNGHEGLTVYARSLSGLPGADAKAGAQVNVFLRAIEWESRLNFDRIEGDRRALMDRLSKNLDPREREALLSQAVSYRAGKQTNGDFFSYLKTLCATTKIPVDSYRSFFDYIAYVGLVQSIRRADLLNELNVWERALGASLAKTPEEHRLLGMDQDASLLRQLLENEMSPEAWSLFTKRRKDIVSLPARLQEVGDFQEPPEGLAAFLRPHEDFCRLAMERNAVLAANFVRQMDASRATEAVLVTGGFHTPGLQSEFLKRGYSTIVVTPRIEKVEGKPLDVFARDPLPFDKLFAGKPISLSPELLIGQDVGQSFLDLIITAAALSLAPFESDSSGRVRNWSSRKGLHIKNEEHTPSGLVRFLINVRGSEIRLLAGPKEVIEKNRSSEEIVEKVDLPNGRSVWVSLFSPRVKEQVKAASPFGRIFLKGKKMMEKMGSHWPDVFSRDDSTGFVGKMFHRVMPLLSLRFAIVPSGPTVREEDPPASFLAEPYLRYNALVRQIVNPRGGAYCLLYGGSGADLSNGLLLSHFTKAFFVSPTHGLTVSDLIRIKEQGVREDPLYAREKHDDGFSDGSRLNGKEKLLSSLSLELKGMSIPFESLEAFDWNGRPGLRFLWKAPGETAPTVREIVFVDADITQPAQYKDVLLERFDLYLQRAGMLIPWAYRDQNSFIKVIAGSMKPGAFFATDDDALDEPGEFVDLSRFFPLDLPVLPIPGDQELLNQVIALRYTRAGLRAWANRQREGYGFLLRLRRMAGSSMAVPLEPTVSLLDRFRRANNENEISIARRGIGISLVMHDGQGREIGKAMVTGKRGEITVTGVEILSTEKGVALTLLAEVARFGLFKGGDGRVLIRGTNNKELVQAARLLFERESLLVGSHRFDRSVKNLTWTNRASASDESLSALLKTPSQSVDVSGSLAMPARAALWPEKGGVSQSLGEGPSKSPPLELVEDRFSRVPDRFLILSQGMKVGTTRAKTFDDVVVLQKIDVEDRPINYRKSGFGSAVILYFAKRASRILDPQRNAAGRPVPLECRDVVNPWVAKHLREKIVLPDTLEYIEVGSAWPLYEPLSPLDWTGSLKEGDPRVAFLLSEKNVNGDGHYIVRFHLRGELRPEIGESARGDFIKSPSSNHSLFVGLGIPLAPLGGALLSMALIGVLLYRDKVREWLTAINAPPWLMKRVITHLPDMSACRSSLVHLSGNALGAGKRFAGKTFRRVFPAGTVKDVKESALPQSLALKKDWQRLLKSNGLDNGALKGLRRAGILPQEDRIPALLPNLARLELALWEAAEQTESSYSLGFPIQAFVVGGSRIFFSEKREDVDVLLCYQPDEALADWIQPATVREAFFQKLAETLPSGATLSPTDEGARVSWIDSKGRHVFDLNVHPVSRSPIDALDEHLRGWFVNPSRDPWALTLARTYYFGSLEQWAEDLAAFSSGTPGRRGRDLSLPKPYDAVSAEGLALLERRLSIPASVFAARTTPGDERKVLFPEQNDFFSPVRHTSEIRFFHSFGLSALLDSLGLNKFVRQDGSVEYGKLIRSMWAAFQSLMRTGFPDPPLTLPSPKGHLKGADPLAEFQPVPGLTVTSRPVNDTLESQERTQFAVALKALLPNAFEMQGVEVRVDPHLLSSVTPSGNRLNQLLTIERNAIHRLPEGKIEGLIRQDASSLLWMRLFSAQTVGVKALAAQVIEAARNGDATTAGAALAAWDDSKFLAGPNPDIVTEVLALIIGMKREQSGSVVAEFANAYNRVRSGLLFPKLWGGQWAGAGSVLSAGPGIVLNLSAIFDETASEALKGQTWVALAAVLVSLERNPNTPLALVVQGKFSTREHVETTLAAFLPRWGMNVLTPTLFVESGGDAKFFAEGKFSLLALQERPQWQRDLKVLGFTEGTLLKGPQWSVELIPLNANFNADLKRILNLLQFIQWHA